MEDLQDLQHAVGRVISERPYVKLLAVPRLQAYELVPGMVVERWEALAQVEGMLAIIEVKIKGGVSENSSS